MEQNITNVSRQVSEKPAKYPNFFKNLEILQRNGIYTERKFASDFNLEERAAINALDLEDGGAKLSKLLKDDISIETVYNAANAGVDIDFMLELLDLVQNIKLDIENGETKIDVMFSCNSHKGRWCANFVANRHKKLKVRELRYSTQHRGWLYLGNGMSMIASDLTEDVIRRLFPQRQYKYHFVFDQSSKTDEGEFENNGK